jgi:putative transposase
MLGKINRLGHRLNRKGVPPDASDGAACRPSATTDQPAGQGHRIYPYRLRGLRIDRPNQVWATDISYIPLARGFMYLVAVMDWHSRRVLSWRVSNTLDTEFCVGTSE